MQKAGSFEKVSFEQFAGAMKGEFGIGETEAKMMHDLIDLPMRATKGSAGYDFKSSVTVKLSPGASVKIPTGIRVKIDDGWWLCCAPRSGLGCNTICSWTTPSALLTATTATPTTRGTSTPRLPTPASKQGKGLSIGAGDRFMQTIFIPYGITYSDAAEGVRNGGWGSTGV